MWWCMFVFEFVFWDRWLDKFMREIAVSVLPKCAINIFYRRHLHLHFEIIELSECKVARGRPGGGHLKRPSPRKCTSTQLLSWKSPISSREKGRAQTPLLWKSTHPQWKPWSAAPPFNDPGLSTCLHCRSYRGVSVPIFLLKYKRYRWWIWSMMWSTVYMECVLSGVSKCFHCRSCRGMSLPIFLFLCCIASK